MRRIFLASILIFALMAFCFPAWAVNPSASNYSTAGGKSWVIRGTLQLNSGSTFTNAGTTTFTSLLNANGGIAVDTSNFTVSGTTGAVETASSMTCLSASVGGGYGSTGVTMSSAGVVQCDGAFTTASSVTADSAAIGGGYGSTGATISTAGVGQFNGALTTDGAITAASATIGGGYGSTGCTIATTGAISADGVATVGGLAFTSASIITNTTGAETLAVTQSGYTVVCTKADGATAITIPDPSASSVGVSFTILQTADQNVTLACATANSNAIVADNVATSDLVTLGTASHKIGSGIRVIGISATKWFAVPLSPTEPLTVEAAD